MSTHKVDPGLTRCSLQGMDVVELMEICVIGIPGVKRSRLRDDLMSLVIVQKSSDRL